MADYDALLRNEPNATISLRKTIWRLIKYRLLFTAVIAILRVAAMFLQMLCLWQLLRHLSGETTFPTWAAALLAVSLAVCTWCVSLFQHNVFHYSLVSGCRVRSLLGGILTRHVLNMTPAQLRDGKARVINLLATDVNSFVEAGTMSMMFLSATFELAGAIAWIGGVVGLAALATLGIIAVTYVAQVLIARRIAVTRFETLAQTDRRIKLIGEYIGGIGVVKLNAWEDRVQAEVRRVRSVEGVALSNSNSWKMILMSFFFVLPGILSSTTFGVLNAYNSSMSPATTFLVLALLQIVARTMIMTPRGVALMANAHVSITRLEAFLTGEVPPPIVVSPPAEGEGVRIRGDFGWNERAKVSLDLACAPASLTVITGGVGSGKSTILQAIMGNCLALSSSYECTVKGTFAYVPQEAWILDTSVRDNILFGLPFDEDWYVKVIRECALEEDIVQWGGDMAEVGEKGVTLSGGQRQRIALARACYANRDVYILDDPLSAVDATVRRHLLQRCICGLLAGKVVILATHQQAALPFADQAFQVDNGKLEALPLPDKQVSSPIGIQKSNGEAVASVIGKGRSITTEEASVHYLRGAATRAYASAGGAFSLFAFFFLLCFAQALRSAGEWWFAAWSRRRYPLSTGVYVGISFALMGSAAVVAIVRAIIFGRFSISASTALHDAMLRATVKSPLSFFETIPLGRILNRYSKDVDLCDDAVPRSAFEFLQMLTMVIGAVVITIVGVPWIGFVLIPLVPGFGFLLYRFIPASRDVKSIEATSRTPTIQLAQHILDGLSVVRAFGMSGRFESDMLKSFDTTTMSVVASDALQRWLGVRIDWLTSTVVLAVGLMVVFIDINPALAGLSLTQSLVLTGMMQFGVRQAAEAESLFSSVDRLHEYGQLPPEEDKGTITAAPDGWPDGRLSFTNLTMSYPSAPDVIALRSLTAHIPSGSKVAIVGRSGAGKSTILGCCFRLVPLPPQSLWVGGIASEELSLSLLRKSLGVIPQAPTLFNGSVRRNLDPFGESTDELLIEALQKVQLRSLASPSGLDTSVGEGGNSLSVGQKQLLCAARALLRHPRLLFMDEATANVDHETDQLLQRFLREQCRGITVVTIAHRLDTIMDYDVVMVLSAGSLVEIGSPAQLAQLDPELPGSHFARLLRSARKSSDENE